GIFHEVLPFDIQFSSEGYGSCTTVPGLGVVFAFEHLRLAFRIVGDDEPEWVEHDHPALGDLVQVFANAKFQQADIDNVIASCHPHPVAKVADTFRRITAAAHPAYGRHTRVVPSADVAFVYQAEKLTLGHDRVVHVESCELILPGGIDIELLYEPVVQLPVWNELQGTDAVGNFFD